MKFVPRVSALESKISLSDMTSLWVSGDPANTIQISNTSQIDSNISPAVPVGSIDGVMPTTPGYHLDIYPPALGYGVPGIPQIPAPLQDPQGILGLPGGAIQIVPPLTPKPVPYYPPPYGIPTYVTLSGLSPTAIS